MRKNPTVKEVIAFTDIQQRVQKNVESKFLV